MAPRGPLLGVQGGIGSNLGLQLIHLPFKPQLAAGRAGSLQQLFHQSPQPPLIHLLDFGPSQQGDRQRVVIPHIEARAWVKNFVPVGRAAAPNAPEAQVHVPGEHLPFASAVSVAIEVIVFVAAIDIAGDRHRGQEINHFRDVDIVIQVIDLGGADQLHPFEQGDQIGIALVFPCFLFCISPQLAGADGRVRQAGEGVVHLVKRPIRVQPQPRKKRVVPAFTIIRIAEIGPVLLEADGKGDVVGRFGIVISLIREDISHVRLIGVDGEQIPSAHRMLVRRVLELEAGIGIKSVTLLRESGAGLSVKSHGHVVIEFSVVKGRTASSGDLVRQAGILNKPVEDRQIVGLRQINNRAEVLWSRKGIQERRQTGEVAIRVPGHDVVPDHLARNEVGGGNASSKNSVASQSVAMLPIIQHRQGDFCAEHNAINHGDGLNRTKRGGDRGRHNDILIKEGNGRRVRNLDDERPQVGVAGAVGRPGRRQREIGRAGRILDEGGGAQFGEDQEIRIIGAGVQSLNRQHVRAGLEQPQPFGDVNVFILDRCRIGAGAGGGDVPIRYERRVSGGNHAAIDQGDESIIVLHPQSEEVEGGRIGDRERDAEVGGGIVVLHQTLNVGGDLVRQVGKTINCRVEERPIRKIVRPGGPGRIERKINHVANLHSSQRDSAKDAVGVSVGDGGAVLLSPV